MSLTSYRAAPPRDFLACPRGQGGKLGARREPCKGKSPISFMARLQGIQRVRSLHPDAGSRTLRIKCS
ncbi:MAG: hypothetical protein DBX00_03070 [Verrucomicrobia bacterium]|nr:MAG: hypothetical protein DBX00_03070 [Verrucomicrobiota bacterium]